MTETVALRLPVRPQVPSYLGWVGALTLAAFTISLLGARAGEHHHFEHGHDHVHAHFFVGAHQHELLHGHAHGQRSVPVGEETPAPEEGEQRSSGFAESPLLVSEVPTSALPTVALERLSDGLSQYPPILWVVSLARPFDPRGPPALPLPPLA